MYNATVDSIPMVNEGVCVLRIRLDGGMKPFQPGQYTTLGLEVGPEKRWVRRTYSLSHPVLYPKTGALVKSEELDFYEFYISRIREKNSEKPDGFRFSECLFQLKPGDRILFGPKITGGYVIEPIGPSQTAAQAVFFATGTGEAPHNAMIWQLLSQGYKGLIVHVVSTRFRWQQLYRETHEKLSQMFFNYQCVYFETREGGDKKYCQDWVASGDLERKTNIKIDPSNTHVYLCGNPAMIAGMKELLEKRGFTVATPAHAGNIHFESYW